MKMGENLQSVPFGAEWDDRCKYNKSMFVGLFLGLDRVTKLFALYEVFCGCNEQSVLVGVVVPNWG